jgi:hypothetical protein
MRRIKRVKDERNQDPLGELNNTNQPYHPQGRKTQNTHTSILLAESNKGNKASNANWNLAVGCTSCVNAKAAVEHGNEYALVNKCDTDACTWSTCSDTDPEEVVAVILPVLELPPTKFKLD